MHPSQIEIDKEYIVKLDNADHDLANLNGSIVTVIQRGVPDKFFGFYHSPHGLSWMFTVKSFMHDAPVLACACCLYPVGDPGELTEEEKVLELNIE